MYRVSLLLSSILIWPTAKAQLSTDSIFTPYGKREYRLYSPNNSTPSSPIVVAIHGCKQNAASFFKGSKLKSAANKYGYKVLLPKQEKLSNPYNCWNWFLNSNQMRSGELSIVISSLDHARKKYGLKTQDIFVLGMSSGGALANNLMNCYPNKFKAVASHSGVPYAATTNPLLAKYVLENGMLNTPYLTALKGYICGGQVRMKTPALIIQGREDEVVSIKNAKDITKQYLLYNEFAGFDSYTSPQTIEELEYGYNTTIKTWKDLDQRVLVKEVVIDKLKHEWSGGDGELEYNQPKGPDATKLIFEFFKSNLSK